MIKDRVGVKVKRKGIKGNIRSTLRVESKASAKTKNLRKRKIEEVFNYETEDNKSDEGREKNNDSLTIHFLQRVSLSSKVSLRKELKKTNK